MILQRASHNFSSRRGVPVHENDNWIILSAGAASRGVRLIIRIAPALRHHHLTTPEEVSGNCYSLAKNTARVFAKVEHQALYSAFAQLLERIFQFLAGVFVELIDIYVRDPRFEHERALHAITWDLITNDVEGHRLVHTLAAQSHLHVRTTR